MKLANILFIASAVSFVAAYDVCAQNTATKTAPATDKPLTPSTMTESQKTVSEAKTPSPMTQAQKIDFIKGATEEEMKNFITNATAEELDQFGDNLLKEVQKNPANTTFIEKCKRYLDLVDEITGEQNAQSKKNLAQLQAQTDFQKGMVSQAQKQIADAKKEIADAKKQIAEAEKKSQEGIDAIE